MRLLTIYLTALFFLPIGAAAQDAEQIVNDAITYWRGATSYAEATMTIHRPEWTRSSSLKSWTKGMKKSLVRFTAPAKDAGNASLTLDNDMWSFTPKINKTIKIPPSMMSQSWMGSDFSYDDLSKSDDIIDQYDHKLLRTEESEGKKVYVVESVPHPSAPIVWGKEILRIRDDKVILSREFYDQDMKLYKRMTADMIEKVDGKFFAKRVRMSKVQSDDEWTEVMHNTIKFEEEIAENVFTLANLSHPRE